MMMMSIPNPVTPGTSPVDRHPHHQPVLPPDDPNSDRMDRAPDIDPRPLDSPIEAPSEEPGTEAPAARVCDGTWPSSAFAVREWLRIVGSTQATPPSSFSCSGSWS